MRLDRRRRGGGTACLSVWGRPAACPAQGLEIEKETGPGRRGWDSTMGERVRGKKAGGRAGFSGTGLRKKRKRHPLRRVPGAENPERPAKLLPQDSTTQPSHPNRGRRPQSSPERPAWTPLRWAKKHSWPTGTPFERPKTIVGPPKIGFQWDGVHFRATRTGSA